MNDSIHRRNHFSVLLLLTLFAASFAGAAPASADHTAAPTSVTIAGDLQSELGCPGDWQPECATTHLADQGNGVWRAAFTVPAGSWQYKAALNDSWDESYAGNHTASGNTTLDQPAAGAVRFYYDHKTHAVLDSVMDKIAVVAGSFQSELGCSGDWAPDCVRSLMTDADGDGTYTFETAALPVGTYEFKVALNETWDTSYPADNQSFTTTTDGQKVSFTWNATSNAVTVNVQSATSGHDNNVEYDGLAHNSQRDVYRTPFGAVNPGTPVTLRFRTFHDDVTGVRARVYDAATQQQFFRALTPAATDIGCYGGVPATKTCDFWTTTITPTQIGTLYYRFIVRDGTATAYYADDQFKDGGPGVATPNEVDNSYVITVFDPNFKPIPWMQDAVIYQIFPDRFRNGDPTNDLETGTPRYDDPVIALDWDTLPEGYCRKYADANATTCPPRFPPATGEIEQPRGRDYMGGDLKGVQQRLDYLQQLGVTVIYFNPIFNAASDHSYDTQDYLAIDPAFGTQQDWDALVAAADAKGIRIVLDGVFNHVSSDSRYFDRYSHFADVGACESVNSPYRSWFFFKDKPNGPCAGPDGEHTMTYDAWFGFDSLPVLDKNNQQVRDLIYAGNDSVARHWLNDGAAGWRLDVMGDGSFPPEFWQQFRSSVKAAKADAPIIGELWKKDEVLPKIHGDQADTTMNYRFRNAILGFFGTVDDKGFPDDGASNQPPSLFARKIMSTREDYPDAVFYTLMNLMDSHDTQRILWSLTPGERTRAAKELDAANVARGKQNLRLATVVQMTMPGAPTIYYGDEVALTGDDDPDDRRTFPWGDAGNTTTAYISDTAMLAHYQTLTSIRAANPVLRDGDIRFLLTDDATRAMAYGRRTADAVAIIAVNPGDVAQTLAISTTGYVRDGVQFTDALSSTFTAATANGALTVSMPARSGAIFLANSAQDLAPPAAPTGLVATPGNGQVSLTWDAVSGASSYNVYRSRLSGGGYDLLGNASGPSATDTNVTNGTRYYYIVKALDNAGNESAASNEAAATPAFPIGYAVLQSPKEITHTIGITPTAPIYGQVYAKGLTDTSASCTNVLAEVGYGAQGSAPASWTTWQPMTCNAGYDFTQNNDEYQATLRPDQVGDFDLLVRFSTDNGLTWTYGDRDGVGSANPGLLRVQPNSDTTPPAAPQNLKVANWSSDFIALRWDAAPDAALYRVYRSTITGTFDFAQPLAEVISNTLTYTDSDVVSGTTYHYVVTALDAALNASAPSNEVSQQAEQRLVQVTFRARVPDETPAGDLVYIAGSSAQAFGAEWNPGLQPMTKVAPNLWEYTTNVVDGTQLQYKYTRGAWERGEWWGTIVSTANRNVTISYGANGTQLVDDSATDWGNGSDEHKAVQRWRDPLVQQTTPVGSQPSATWSTPVSATGALSQVLALTDASGAAVSGTVSMSGTDTFVFTPAQPLATGVYTATAFNVKRADVGGEAVPMQQPYTWTFTVGSAPSAGYDFGIAAMTNTLSGTAGTTVTYKLMLINTGTLTDSYVISATGSWPTSAPATVGPLGPGQIAAVEVQIAIPADAADGAHASSRVSAASQSQPALTRAILLTTRANAPSPAPGNGTKTYLPLLGK